MRPFLFFTFLILFSIESIAYVAFGSHTPALFKYQVDSFGSTRLLDLNFMVGAHLKIPVKFLKGHYARPEIGLNFDSSEMEDEYGRSTIYILYDLAWEWKKNIFLRYGVGTFIDKVFGPGGTKVQNNGGSFSTFYKPVGKAYSYTSSINLGIEYQLEYGGGPLESRLFRPMFRVETHTFSPLSSNQRAFSVSVNMVFISKKRLIL